MKNNKDKKKDYYYFTKGAVIPISIATSLFYLGKKIPNNLWILDFTLHNAFKALIIGGLISIVCFYLKKYLFKEKHPLNKSVLLGLLAAEILIFVNKDSKNSMATITLFLFFYFHAVEH
tara:strand:+ start:21 stop:377 length:357 start_codon:yes stop_codon:yes gene_type:complete